MTRFQSLGIAFTVLILTAFLIDAAVVEWVQSKSGPLRFWGKAISAIGNSGWMAIFLLIWAFLAAVMATQTDDLFGRRCAKLLLKLAIVLFFSVLLSGICVQFLKHVLGRARPSLFEELGAFSFQPFAFDMRQNSFPSGHSTTMGAVAMVSAMVVPQFRLYLFSLAVMVGLARIFDGAHYPSDIVAGLALGAATSYVFMLTLIEKGDMPQVGGLKWAAVGRKLMTWYRALVCPRPRQGEDVLLLKYFIMVLAVSLLALVIFISKPEIDVATSRLFFDPEDGFWLDDSAFLAGLRKAFFLAIAGMFITALLLWYLSLRMRRKATVDPAIWGFVVSALVLGPGLIANSLFKTHWGRARPADIEAFGGEASFTLPFQFANECARNCSFVSGEGSGIAMLFFVCVALSWKWVKKHPLLILTLSGSIAGFGILMRVIKGRHFLSDTVFAILIMALVVMVLYRAFDVSKRRDQLSRLSLAQDGSLFLAYVLSAPSQEFSLRRDLWRGLQAIGIIGQTTSCILASVFGSIPDLRPVVRRSVGR